MPTVASTSSDIEEKDVGGLTDAAGFGRFQDTIYAAGFLRGETPKVTTDLNKIESQAQTVLEDGPFIFVSGGAGSKKTMHANRVAFEKWGVIPRMLKPVTRRDLRVNLFGEVYDTPIIMAPIGVQGLFHPDGESGVARACASLNIPYTLSTAATSTIETIAAVSGSSPRWFQLYWPHDDTITRSLLSRAKSSGYSVLVVTLDTWTLGWRPEDLDLAYLPFLHGTGTVIGISDPVYRRKFEKRFGKSVEGDPERAQQEWLRQSAGGIAHSWDQIAVLREAWDGPIVLKGIQHVDDARMALDSGVQGIVVSNHGGRQVDGAVGSLDMLPEIVEAVGDRLTVLFDSGIRSGSDITKALALGAKAVLVGRPVIYGLAIDGEAGAKQVLQGLLADLDITMGLVGAGSVEECNKNIIRRVG